MLIRDFFQVKLAKESKLLTTSITRVGRFAFHMLPMGLSSSNEYYQKRMSQILENLDGVICQMDDVLVFGRTDNEHDKRRSKVLSRLERANVTLNSAKCEFKKTSVKFVGHIVSADGISADPQKVDGIRNMPPPNNIHGVRSFLGMVNQLGKFTPALSELSKPLRDLLFVYQ